MKRAILGAILIFACCSTILGQPADTRPKFLAADVHPAPAGYPYARTIPVHDNRYEVKSAAMLDLVRIAYGFDADKILGGPSWLEMDRFDITAKLPGETSPDDQKLMLQTLLEDRFKLVTRKETKSIAGFALIAGKKPALKEAAGTEESGCKLQSSSGPAPEGGGMFMTSINGAVVRIAISGNTMLTYNCRNETMAAFAEGLHTMLGSNIGTSPVLEETGLKGAWNFDLSFSLSISLPISGGSSTERVTVADAIDKQLGLKLEPRQIPTPVLVVESVNRTPSANAPDLAQVMPPMPPATEFDVASVKPTDPGSSAMNFQVQPGGRLNIRGFPMRSLLMYAFMDPISRRTSQLTGTPKWADSARFDIVAKTPPDTAPLDMMSMGPPLLALLKDRFKLAYHIDQQPGTAYNLQAAKPKMKTADPAGRTSCKRAAAPAGSPGGSLVMTCQNITMTQFADWLSSNGVGVNGPVSDATGLNGAWDFSLTYTYAMPAALARGVETGQPGGDLPAAAEPTAGYTLFEALEKQLGLKLETTKKPQPVVVIDHLEEKPTEDQ
ncbi:MAG: TIGR03435 family protein [Verrucomicrobiota bacterium]